MDPPRTLLSWIGATDLRVCERDSSSGAGPIAQATSTCRFHRILLLSAYPAARTAAYASWLRERVGCPVELREAELSNGSLTS